MDVKLESINNVKSDTYATNGLPSMALDSGSPPAIPDRGRLCRNDAIFAIMRIADTGRACLDMGCRGCFKTQPSMEPRFRRSMPE